MRLRPNPPVATASSGPARAQAMVNSDCNCPATETETPSSSAIGSSTPAKTNTPVVMQSGANISAKKRMAQAPIGWMKQEVVAVARIRPFWSSITPSAVAMRRPRVCTRPLQRT